MVAAFSGFVAGRVAGLQEFGVGLALAILIDATIVRAILVPALMAVLGRWNWWLPARIARLARVQASPLVERGTAARGSLLRDADAYLTIVIASRIARQLVAEREAGRVLRVGQDGHHAVRACSDTTAAACRAAGTCRSGACRARRSPPGS